MEIKNINDLWGNNQAKRVVEIALVGKLSVKLIGNEEAEALGRFLKKQGIEVYVFKPCRCGNYGDWNKACKCKPLVLREHFKKIEEVKTDLVAEVKRALPDEIGELKIEENISNEAVKFLKEAIIRLYLSQADVHRIIKVAKTIRDLNGKKEIEAEHLAEALQLRII
jgi:predicted ATPase with chaperone activity